MNNSNLGTYTNFVNLLNLCALSVPSGARADGLPSSLTLIGAAGQDAHLAGIASAIQANANQPMGATGRRPLPLAARSTRAAAGQIELAVVGAHLSGMPLNRELLDLSATFLRTAATVADYRLFALPATQPPKPGLLRVAAGTGHAIAVEVWSLAPAAFGLFVSRIPAPLGIGTLALADGTSVKGFLCEAEALKSAHDVSGFGGWRAFVQSMVKN